MDLSRRTFLKGSSLLFVAPAIVRAESLMKIWVPGDDKIIEDASRFNVSVLGLQMGDKYIITQKGLGRAITGIVGENSPLALTHFIPDLNQNPVKVQLLRKLSPNLESSRQILDVSRVDTTYRVFDFRLSG